jgi:hypothetical protein
MAKELTVIEIDLLNPIEVDVDGMDQLAKQVELTAPSATHAGQASIIKNFCGRIMDQQIEKNKNRKQPEESGKKKGAKSKKEERFSGETMIQILTMSILEEPEQLEKMYNLFRIMLCNGCGKVDGQDFTKYLFEQLSFKDMENLFGEYVVNFLLDSLVN